MEFSKIFCELCNHIETFPWKNTIDSETIYNIAYKNFSNLTTGKTKNKHCFRLAGQSGSGKTTQLLPASNNFFSKNNLNPIIFAVRNFAALHPEYDEIVKNCDKNEIREITNSFALRCLLISLALAIENGYDILLDLTLLSSGVEGFINKFLIKNNYNYITLLLCVNIEISNHFIEKRKLLNGVEGKRIVYKSSTTFFYTTLKEAVKFYAENFPATRVIIWNAYLPKPIYDGNFKDAEKVFFNEIENISYNFSNEDLLREEKVEYLIENIIL